MLKNLSPQLYEMTHYEYYLANNRKKKNNKNTRTNSLKFIKQMLNKALEKGGINELPTRFKLERIEGNKEHLTMYELKQLQELYHSKKLIPNQQKVLEYFLFACYTGLRYSDICEIKHRHIENDVIDNNEVKFLVFDMHKTGKPVDIPILPFPEQFLKDGLPNQNIFHVFTNQSTNRHLKKIIAVTGIKKNVTFHTARHTLGSTGSDMGMDIQTISAILGHTDIRTTQTYTKVSRKKKLDGLMLMKENTA